MAVNFVDLEVLPSVSSMPVVLPSVSSAPVVVPNLESPVMAESAAMPVAVPATPTVRATAALDRAPSYWVRRRREQELMARALIDESSG